MKKIKQNIDFTTPDEWDEINNIEFIFRRDPNSKYNRRTVQNIIAFDTETSNGFMLKNGDVIAFDMARYDNGIIAERKHTPPALCPDLQYKIEIDNSTPVSLTYFWQIAIEDGRGGIKKFMGRTWPEYAAFHEKLNHEILRQALFGFNCIQRDSETQRALKAKQTITIYEYAHNLGFDWQGVQNIYHDKFLSKSKDKNNHVFARSPRKPIKSSARLHGVTVEYRDTAIFAQKSLKAWAKDCPNCPLEKLPDFDYLTIKTPEDVLTPDEIHYGLNDVAIIIYCMEHERNIYKNLESIPLTQTGKVRRVLHSDVCKINPIWAANCWCQTAMYTPQYFDILGQLYQGGYTHANSSHTGHILKNCIQFDFASSYPSVLTNGKFPIKGLHEDDVKNFTKYEDIDPETGDIRWFARIRINKRIAAKLTHSYWSSSKLVFNTWTLKEMNPICDNGRIYRANHLEAYFTDTDWYTFRKAYAIEDNDYECMELYSGESDYLPTELVRVILDYFENKTSLKGKPNSETLYNESKQFINGIYGCFVFKLFCKEIIYTPDGWTKIALDEMMFRDKKDSLKLEDQFGFFELGVWTSALARKRLWDFILEFDYKVWYCDTDSIKGEFGPEELTFVDNYNKWIEQLEDATCRHHNFTDNPFVAETYVSDEDRKAGKHGKLKRLGIMEREEDCEFKTLGAKRYAEKIYNDKKGIYEIKTTIAGLPKASGERKIKSLDEFNEDLFFLTSESDKKCIYYNDNQPETHWPGRDGKIYVSHDKFGACLKPVTFDMKVTEEYERFFNMIQNGYNSNHEFLDDVYDEFALHNMIAEM